MGDTPPFASTHEALGMLRTVLGYLGAGASEMAAQAQAECLQELEQLDAVKTATRAEILGAFTAAQGYSADGDYSPRSWLMHRTKVTRGSAAGYLAWVRRAAAHPRVAAALAEAAVSESYARKMCEWTDKLAPDCRDAADAILIAAAVAGAQLTDLAELAAEIYTRSLPELSGDEPDETFEDRRVMVETTFGGAGVISGDLTPECSAVVTAVLESLGAPAGAEDTRTKEQRYHDGLQEAMMRLVAAGLLPERAGQPVKVWAHVSLAELRALDDESVLAGQWVGEMAARWAARRAAAAEGAGSDGGAWLEGRAAKAIACDAVITPVVTGDIDPGVLDDLVRLCVELDRIEHGTAPVGDNCQADAQPEGSPSRETLRQAIIGKAVDLLSGPGGLASFLRTQQLGARLAGPSLPLDIGFSKTIPPGIRNAVILRDRRCRWPGSTCSTGIAQARGPACSELLLTAPNPASDPQQADQRVVSYLQAYPGIDAVMTFNGAVVTALGHGRVGKGQDRHLRPQLASDQRSAVRHHRFRIDQQLYLQGYLPIVTLYLYLETHGISVSSGSVLQTGPFV